MSDTKRTMHEIMVALAPLFEFSDADLAKFDQAPAARTPTKDCVHNTLGGASTPVADSDHWNRLWDEAHRAPANVGSKHRGVADDNGTFAYIDIAYIDINDAPEPPESATLAKARAMRDDWNIAVNDTAWDALESLIKAADQRHAEVVADCITVIEENANKNRAEVEQLKGERNALLSRVNAAEARAGELRQIAQKYEDRYFETKRESEHYQTLDIEAVVDRDRYKHQRDAAIRAATELIGKSRCFTTLPLVLHACDEAEDAIKALKGE